ncbi:MAG: ThiF family adenylyltransferase [Bacteroidaceae bacterium]|nr:ThiF family adenylyltransferase [Bacteroidaceae bacterium]
MTPSIFQRAETLLGTNVMQRLSSVHVVLMGVGGVGSWCAEGLIRTGLQHLTIIDCDNVETSNINRQLMATSATIGQSKVEALRKHLLEINPEAEITALHRRYSGEPLEGELKADYVIDAIDSLDCKLALIMQATSSSDITFFSSMGAAMKTDPTRIKVSEFWKVQGCPLARALRNRIKKSKDFPKKKFQCVFSDEEPIGNMGSIVQVTAVFGFTLCSLVINDIKNKVQA